MPSKKIILKQILVLLVLSYFFLMFGNGILSLTNPDEVFYTQTAKEMVQKNSWMTPYLFGQPQFEKPILLYWLMRSGFLVFGVNSFSARFFPALFAILGVIAVYLLALIGFKNEKKAFLAGLVAMSYGLYIGLARSVFTDMIFSVLILFSLASFFWAYTEIKYRRPGIILIFIFSGLAVLAKGPLGFLIPFAVIFIFLLLRRDIKYLFRADFFLGGVIFLAISLPWYVLMVKKYGTTFTHEFFYNDHWRRLIEAEHLSNDTWYFYPLSMIGCMFPWSVYVVAGLAYLFRRLKRNASPMHLFLGLWIVITLLAFQFAHSKLISYIFPLFPALAIIVADFICDFGADKNKLALRIASLATFFVILAIPVGLWIGSRAYSFYISTKLPVYILSFLLLGLAGVFLAFSLKDKFIKSAHTLMLAIPLIMFFVPFVAQHVEPYISSKTASEYLLKNYDPKGRLLCSKFFARGVHYYTDREVAIIDINGKGYFSPHPVPFFSSMEAVNDFLRVQGITYGIMRKSGWARIKVLPEKEFKCTLLESIGDAYLVKIEYSGR
jgi:4-amino-4-deoxy-L-arabinose transferase-like glycosyltransferase